MAAIRILFLLSVSFTLVFSEKHLPDLPEIFVEEIVKVDDWQWIKASEVTLEGDDGYVQKTENGFIITKNCYGVSFKCRASYPIFWSIDKPEEISKMFGHSINTFTIRNGTTDKKTGSSNYEAVLRFWTDDIVFTRNYTCRSVDNEHLQTTSFLFVQGPSQNYLVNAGKKLEIGVDDHEILDVPCNVATEDVEVLLFKEEIEMTIPFKTSTWKQLSLNESIKFDPRRGFSLKVADLMDILGLYKCTIDENEDDVVIFNIDLLSPLPDPSQETFEMRSHLVGSAKIEYDYLEDSVVCCSNSDKKPTMQTATCSSPTECEISKRIFLSGDPNQKGLYDYYYSYNHDQNLTPNCTRSYLYLPTFWVKCKGDGIDVLSQFYYQFKQTKERLDQIDHSRNNYYGFPNVFDVIPVTHSVSLDNLLFLSYNQISKPEYEDMQRMQNERYYDYDLRYRVGQVSNDDGTLYSGQALLLKCYYSVYILSEGGYWEMLWKNGTKKHKQGRIVADPYLMGSLTTALILDDQLTSISCFGGVWNSSKWVSKSVNLTVQVPAVPTIDGPEVIEVYLVLNGTDAKLECNFVAKPAPEVYWKQDGRILSSSEYYEIEQQNNTSVLTISKITHESHGEFSCSVTNVGGSVVKTFIVYVEEQGVTHGLTIAAVVITFIVVGGYLAFIIWKTQIHRKVLQSMQASTYQDPA